MVNWDTVWELEDDVCMRFLIQRVQRAKVTVNDTMIGEIGRGHLVFVGVSENDTETIADKMMDKLVKLRIFEDSDGKTNLSITDIGGEILVVSQFTLYADVKKCNRPSFAKAGNPTLANHLYEYILEGLEKRKIPVFHGSFGADMKVELINDGPFSVWIDSDELWVV